MISEGIFNNDIVIIKKQSVAENGQTVVAIIDNNEATLKKLYREKNRFRLEPRNPNMLPLYRNEVEIRGVVVQVIRHFGKNIEKNTVKTKSGICRLWANIQQKNRKNYKKNYKFMTIKKIQKRQNKIVAMFTKKQQEFINEAINIEYKLAMIEEGYELKDLD